MKNRDQAVGQPGGFGRHDAHLGPERFQPLREHARDSGTAGDIPGTRINVHNLLEQLQRAGTIGDRRLINAVISRRGGLRPRAAQRT